MKINVLLGIWLAMAAAVFATSARAAELRELRGRVVDENAQLVVGVDVSYFWRANGSGLDKDGKLLDLKIEANQKEFWGHLGQMEPGVPEVAKTGPDGQFTISIPDNHHSLVAMDPSRSRGGMGIVSKADPAAPIEIRMGPLVRVRGTFEGPVKGVVPGWACLCMNVPVDPTRPLDMTRLVLCGSFEGKFQMSLPPGRYLIEANDNDIEAQLYGKPIELSAQEPEVDLGVLFLPPSNSVVAKRKQSQAKGTWGDYRKHYGRTPPAWHASDARGVSKDAQLSDFKGKWVVLEFWSFGCVPCLKRSLPELMKFYDEHASERDKFEVLTICLDTEGELKSMADVDRELKPIVEHVWGGKTIAFPILLDNTFQTWENFGLKGVSTLLLIDPKGNLVEGDLATLAEKLKP